MEAVGIQNALVCSLTAECLREPAVYAADAAFLIVKSDQSIHDWTYTFIGYKGTGHPRRLRSSGNGTDHCEHLGRVLMQMLELLTQQLALTHERLCVKFS